MSALGHHLPPRRLSVIEIVGEMREVAEADLVVLYAFREGCAWLHKSRQGKASQPDLSGLDLRGAVALLVDLKEGTVRVRPTRNVGTGL